MTGSEFLEKLQGLADTRLGPSSTHSPAGDSALPAGFPRAHREFLALADGVEVYGGYFRLFGATDEAAIPMSSWNSPQLWKFAWDGRVDSFWCFGETAWGDQYAYRLEDLSSSAPPVYFLESITMRGEVISPTFEGFLENEFFRNTRDPYDDVLVAARRRVGDLKPDEHILYQPSLLLGGEESLDNVQKMPAVAAMTVQGDLCVQLDGQPSSRSIKEIRTVEDDRGRLRLKVIWA
jgi:hypothetical protein